MPSKSKKQAKLMAAAAHNPSFARRVGVPQSVAKEYNHADAGTGILKGKKKPAKVRRAPAPAKKAPAKVRRAGYPKQY